MACKRPGVRVPLAPPRSEIFFDRLSEPIETRTAAKYRSGRSSGIDEMHRGRGAFASGLALANKYRAETNLRRDYGSGSRRRIERRGLASESFCRWSADRCGNA